MITQIHSPRRADNSHLGSIPLNNIEEGAINQCYIKKGKTTRQLTGPFVFANIPPVEDKDKEAPSALLS